jgi:predicted porin
VSGGADIPVPHSLPVGSLVQYTVFGATPPTQISPAESNGTVTLQNIAFNTTDDSKKNSGFIYDLSIEKTFRVSSLTLGLSRSTQLRGSQGGTSLRDAVNAHYIYRFSDRFDAFLRGLYTRNRTDEEFFDDEYETYRAGVGANYRITRNLRSSLYWYHTEQRRDLGSASTGPRTERDIVSLLFTYEWNLMR